MPDPELAAGAAVLFKPLPETDELDLAALDPEELGLDEPALDAEPEFDDDCCADAVAA